MATFQLSSAVSLNLGWSQNGVLGNALIVALATVILQKQNSFHRLLSHITIVETLDCCKRGMNLVEMTSQSLHGILAKPGIEPATCCSQVWYASYGAQLNKLGIKSATPCSQIVHLVFTADSLM